MLQSRHLKYSICSGSNLAVIVNSLSQVLECGFTVLSIIWCILNRITLFPEGAALRYGGGRGSCEQAAHSLLLCITPLKSEQYRAERNALPSRHPPMRTQNRDNLVP